MNKFITGLLVGAGAALVVSAYGQGQSAPATDTTADTAAPASCSEATIETNKRVGAAFFTPGGGPNQMFNLMDPGYEQHNPEFKRFGQINHLHGREEFTALMGMMRRGGANPFAPPPGPRPPRGNPVYRVIADCNMVVVLQQRYLPDPQYQGKFYEAFWFDAWRVKNGKLAEHWDAATIPDPVPEFLKVPLKDMKPAGSPASTGR